MAGFIIFSPATYPIPDVSSPGQRTASKTADYSKFQRFQSLMEISDLGTSMRAPYRSSGS